MARIGFLLGMLALACAPAVTTFHGRSVYHGVENEVKEVGPGHWAGTWKIVGVNIDRVGEKGEEALWCTESGAFDGVWDSSGALTSCTNRSKSTCYAGDGSSNTAENTATCKPGLKEGLLTFEGTSRKLSGTGRFEGGDMTASWTSWQLTRPPGDLNYSIYTTTVTNPPRK
jgi:hypothetical protein